MRSKYAILNSLSAAVLQVILLIQAMLIPRMIIMHYGSDVNGLIYSSQQLFNQLNYIETGFYMAFLYILFKPISRNDQNSIKSVFEMIKSKYRSLFFILLLFLFLISIFYPIFLGTSKSNFLDYSSLIFVVGFANILNIYLFFKYRAILVASQKEYIISLIFVSSIIFSVIFSYLFIILGVNILIVRLVPVGSVLIRSLILKIYVRRRFDYIYLVNHNDNNNNNNISSSTTDSKILNDVSFRTVFPALVFQISISLPVIIPSFIISIIASLSISSVFSVYNSIFFGLIGITGIFVVGIPASFGNMYANEEHSLLKSNIRFFETFISIISVVMYSSFSILVFSFIRIYISFETDINYIDNYYPFLFSIWGIIHNFRIAPNAYVTASGKYSILLKSNLLYIAAVFVFGFLAGYLFNQYYVIAVIIILSLIKNISLYFYNNEHEIFCIKSSILKLVLPIVLLIIFYYTSTLVNIRVDSILEWIILGATCFILISIVTFIMYYVFCKSDVISIISKIYLGFKTIFRRG